MRHRRLSPTERATLYAFRIVRAGLVLTVTVALLALTVALCVLGDPAP
ncbi:hypothetical protein [Streptomyces milbemycinicus]|nr:hypothetical protein [Streptomyces milbemycinicus]